MERTFLDGEVDSAFVEGAAQRIRMSVRDSGTAEPLAYRGRGARPDGAHKKMS